jgi:hypothetical protein
MFSAGEANALAGTAHGINFGSQKRSCLVRVWAGPPLSRGPGFASDTSASPATKSDKVGAKSVALATRRQVAGVCVFRYDTRDEAAAESRK